MTFSLSAVVTSLVAETAAPRGGAQRLMSRLSPVGEILGLLLFVAAAGVGVTLLVATAAGMLGEERRIVRAFHAGLGMRPDASLIAYGAGRGVAVSLFTEELVTVWDRGGWRLVYPLEALAGAELELDGEVAARVVRGEPGRRLEHAAGIEDDVRLRLLFDDPRHPDFEMRLWPCRKTGPAPGTPREAIADANRWMARVEAILKRAGRAAVRTPPTPAPVQVDREDLFSDQEDTDALAN